MGRGSEAMACAGAPCTQPRRQSACAQRVDQWLWFVGVSDKTTAQRLSHHIIMQCSDTK